MMHARRKDAAETLREVAAEWAIRIDVNDLTDAENARLDAWLAADPAHAAALQRALLLWSELDGAATVAGVRRRGKAHAALRTRGRHRRRQLLAAAAAAAIAFVFGTGVVFRQDLGIWLRADMHTGTGESRSVNLAGGSTLKLDARTAVAFHDDAGYRVVELLKGRVQVDVGHADPRPFHLRVHGAEVVDIGTVFQVDSRSDETEVSVSQGSVSVSSAGQTSAASAGESLVIDADGLPSRASTADIDSLTAWTRGRLIFEDLPLTDVVDELQRYYPGRIVIVDAGAGRRRVSGVFDASRPMDALRAIERSLHLRLRQWPGDIVTIDV